MGDRRVELDARGDGAGEPWDVDITVLQHGVTPLTDVKPAVTIRNGDATQDVRREADRQARRLPRVGGVPDRRDVELRGRRRLHQPAAAHVPAGADRRRARRAAPPTTDDGGPNLLLAARRASRCCSPRSRCCCVPRAAATPAAAGGVRATTLAAGGLACAGAAMTIAAFAGGGRRRARARAAPRRATGDRGAQVFAEQGCGSLPHVRARQRPRRRSARTSRCRCNGEIARLRAASRSSRPTRTSPQGWSAGTMPDDFAQPDRPARPRPAGRVPDEGRGG